MNGQVTTKFHIKINLEGKLIFLGSYCDKPTREVHHLLLEKNITETIGLHSALRKIEQKINLKSTDLDNNIFSLSRQVARLERTNRKIKVVFLVHNIATWDSLASVYERMCKDDQIKVMIVTIPRRFPGETQFGHEEENHNFFEIRKIPHLRFSRPNAYENLQILKYINPNAIFRQSPWETDIPEIYSTASLSFTNIFYVPYYGFNLVDNFTANPNERDFQADSHFHHNCAQIFCESEITKRMMSKKNIRGGDNFIVTGHPKLEKLLDSSNKPKWPIINVYTKRKKRIIWAPHHSFTGSGWLSFGLFKEVYMDMLALAKSKDDIEIVLKPHPALFSNIVKHDLVTRQALDEFLKEWNSLPHTTIVEGGDYGPLMAASDIMLTDGISFLAEYLMFWEKPLIFLRNPSHSPFNEIGKLVEKATYIVENIQEIQILLEKLDQNDYDNKHREIRKKVAEQLMPFRKGAAQRIVKSVKSYFNLRN